MTDVAVRGVWPTATAADGERATNYNRRPDGNLTLLGAAKRWPTARAEDAESCGNHPGATDSLTGATRNWSTPCAADVRQRFRKRLKGQPGQDLVTQSSQWLTPNTPNGGRSVPAEIVAARGASPAGKKTVRLESQARLWATPRSITGGGESAKRKQELGREESGGGDLQAQSQTWPTPAATAINDGENPETFDQRRLELRAKGINGNGAGEPLTVSAVRFSRPGPETPEPGATSSASSPGSAQRFRLNPTFVEWLMGFPLGWSTPESIGFGRPEMESYLSKQQGLLWSLFNERRAA